MPKKRGARSLEMNAAARDVYALVADIRRMGEWSPETFRARWVGHPSEPRPGARFRGWNRWLFFVWPTDPVIEAAEPGVVFSFVTTLFGMGRFTRWTYRFSDRPGGGTMVEESWEQVGTVPLFSRVFLSGRRERQLSAAMDRTLQRIKAAAEG
ncbi:MAG: SRPBCC family protein [Acidimicrobiia bacterium]